MSGSIAVTTGLMMRISSFFLYLDYDSNVEQVKGHVMFKDMAADEYLASAGIANDWPYGRGA